MKKIATFIVEKRLIIFAVFIVALIYCALSLGKVKVNSDIAALLPPETTTRRALSILEEEFSPFSMADVMVSNITYETAEKLREKIEKTEGVTAVSFDDTKEHYASSSALYIVTVRGNPLDEETINTMDQIKEALDGYDVSISTDIGYDVIGEISSEMVMIILCALIVIILVMLFTSKSYFEIVVMMIVFGVSALLNAGTNYWMGEISSVTHTVAVILQLALAIDYAIILCHRFQNEYEKQGKVKAALIDALAFSIVEISSSSLTTIAGLAALTLMQLRLGFDLGMVLIKGIAFSLLTVFLLMPGLIMVFHKPILRTRHKSLVPDMTQWGKILTKKVPVFLLIFVVLLPLAIYASYNCKFSFSDSTTDRITYSERDLLKQKIKDTFSETNYILVLVPKGDYQKEKVLLNGINELDHVKAAHGVSNVEITEEKTLTDSFTAREFSELLGVDIETAELLYALYGYENQQYQPILGDREAYAVPLLDIIEFLVGAVDKGMVTLDSEQEEYLNEMWGRLKVALEQMRGTNYVCMAVEAAVPAQGETSYALVDNINALAKDLYGEDVLIGGMVNVAKDLETSFRFDNWMVTLFTIAFVFIVLMIAFKSFGGTLLLILVIQGSIWLNFAFPMITGKNIFFMAYLIICAIQMGATIDYAIVLYNRFYTNQVTMPPKEAMIKAINESFATILTSGTIMTAAGFLIAYMTSDIYVASIGMALGRGTLISVIVVLTVLPQLLLFGNKFIKKTTINVKKLTGGDADAE